MNIIGTQFYDGGKKKCPEKTSELRISSKVEVRQEGRRRKNKLQTRKQLAGAGCIGVYSGRAGRHVCLLLLPLEERGEILAPEELGRKEKEKQNPSAD